MIRRALLTWTTHKRTALKLTGSELNVPHKNIGEHWHLCGLYWCFFWVQVFNYQSGAHNVIEIPALSCDALKSNNARTLASQSAPTPVRVPLSQPGVQYFTCSVADHCEEGQLIQVTTAGASELLSAFEPPPLPLPLPLPPPPALTSFTLPLLPRQLQIHCSVPLINPPLY